MRSLRCVALIALPFLLSSSLVVGQAPRLYGQWDFPDVQENGVTYKTSMVFFHNRSKELDEVMQIVNCVARDKSVPAHASAKVQINSREYSILEEASDSESRDGIPCTADVHPGTTSYTLSPDGSKAEIVQGGQTITLMRRR
jgi:hypothetical protein